MPGHGTNGAYDALNSATDFAVARAGLGIGTITHIVSIAGKTIGDGTSKPLSTIFASLLAAQVIFPSAVALSDELDWAALQSLIDHAPTGARIGLAPAATYVINRPLAISGSVNLAGAGAVPLRRSVTVTFADFDMPGVAPYLSGTVIEQTAAATDAIQITGTATIVNLYDFGILFAPAIRHVNTGHGINATPTITYSGGHDHGLYNSTWRNIMCFGHDGNHYAYNFVNPIVGMFDSLVSWGGGGINMICDSYAGNYGNCVFLQPQSTLYCAGSAHSIHLAGRVSGGTSGYLNLLVFVRPSSGVEAVTAKFPETAPGPTISTQYAFHSSHEVGNVTLIQPDFEPTASNVKVALPNGNYFITPDGLTGELSNTGFEWMRSNASYMDNNLKARGNSSTATFVPHAGTSPPAPIGTNAGNLSGSVSFGSGTSPAAGSMLDVAFTAYAGTNYRIALTPLNAATAALGLYAVKSGGYFTICASNAPAASQANTTYAVDYQLTFLS